MTSRPVSLSPRPSRAGRPEGAVGLDTLYLELVNTCNSRCETCPITFGKVEPEAMLTYDDCVGIAAEAPDLRRAVLHGIGEPLLHPELARVVAHLAARGVGTCFNTNGLLLDARRGAELLAAGLSDLRVSLDAAAAGTYRRVRGVAGHKRVLSNMARFAGERDRLGLSTPEMTVYFTAMRTNLDELPAVVAQAAGAGAARVVVQRLTYWGDGLATESQSLYRVLAARERAVLAEAAAVADAAGISLDGTGGVSALESLEGIDGRSGCRRPWNSAYVTANGNVYACCIAPFTGVAHDDLVLGNVFRSGLAAVWTGARYRAVRSGLTEGPPPNFCEGCGERWSY